LELGNNPKFFADKTSRSFGITDSSVAIFGQEIKRGPYDGDFLSDMVTYQRFRSLIRVMRQNCSDVFLQQKISAVYRAHEALRCFLAAEISNLLPRMQNFSA